MSFKPAVPGLVNVVLGCSGMSGGGKTHSAIRVATGLSGEKPFAFASTENNKESIFSRAYRFHVDRIDPPYKPSAYAEKIIAAEKEGFSTLVIDSGSHMQEGEGGMIDWHEKEVDRLSDGRAARREAYNWPAWAKPKQDLAKLIQVILATPLNLIFCLRAAERSEMKEVERDGRKVKEIVPKQTLSGFRGIVPICPKELPYELIASLVLLPDAPGVPRPIRVPYGFDLESALEEDGRLGEKFGRALGAWAQQFKVGQRPQVGLPVASFLSEVILAAIREAAMLAPEADRPRVQAELAQRSLESFGRGRGETSLLKAIHEWRPAVICHECGMAPCSDECSLHGKAVPA